ncbi:MAG TPA: sterol desaturase family protein [Polyangiaceae bacterium]|nr:sterol desaturase family protein [Polyangiaceae bacterium]
MENLPLYLLLAVFGFFAVWDGIRPARKFEKIPLWRAKGILFLVLGLAVSSAVPLLTDEWLARHQLIDASGLGIAGGAIVGLLVTQLVGYWWHRALHRVPLLWRFHQMHHSAERVDIYGSLYFHPVDIAGFTLMGSVALVLLVGVRPEAAVIASITSTCIAIFGHANVKTPRWLGYIVQRPENHAVHHERGVHAYNYGDFACWDLVFGTHKNPETWNAKAGFYHGASRRIGALLLTADVSEEPRDSAAPSTREPLVA